MTRTEKDQKESQMWSDSVKPKLRSPAASSHPGVPRDFLQRAFPWCGGEGAPTSFNSQTIWSKK